MTGLFRAAFDGGSRGNPGIAAWGVAVLDDSGACIEEHAGLLGRTTNNVAEYHGLLEALKLARAAAARRVELLSDSELIVRQIQGRYRVKNPGLKPLFIEAMGYIAAFESFAISHVRREDNRVADRLVNETLDRAMSD
jgi:ribonuclease HI